MKLVLTTNVMLGNAKVQLRQELQEQRRRQELAKTWGDLRTQLAAGARSVFILLFVAALLVFFFDHQATIQHSVEAKVRSVASSIANASQPSRIRQNTLAHEQEVNQITQ